MLSNGLEGLTTSVVQLDSKAGEMGFNLSV